MLSFGQDPGPVRRTGASQRCQSQLLQGIDTNIMDNEGYMGHKQERVKK